MEHYLDAETPKELIYRLGEAHSEYIKGQVERFAEENLSGTVRNAQNGGHLLWKFQNNSNLISYGVVDYFNEPLRACTALKRPYEPFQVSFSSDDHITVWVVNDTPDIKTGRVDVSLVLVYPGKQSRRNNFLLPVNRMNH